MVSWNFIDFNTIAGYLEISLPAVNDTMYELKYEIKDAFHLTELTGQTLHLEGLILSQPLKLTHFEDWWWYILLQKNARNYHASVPSNCCIFFANWLGLASQFLQQESALS